nr:H-type small acid-soluble spore protein [uncultured Bacillus sp.]
MDVKRAEEILHSPVLINVSYRGIPVYLTGVNSTEQTASIFPLDNMEHEQMVDVNGLRELGPSV